MAVNVFKSDAVTDALALEWLAAVPDPYSDDRAVRFAEPFLREVAEAYAREFITRTREHIITTAGMGVLMLPPQTSEHAHEEALEQLVGLFEQQAPATLNPVATELFSELATLVWRSDPALGPPSSLGAPFGLMRTATRYRRPKPSFTQRWYKRS